MAVRTEAAVLWETGQPLRLMPVSVPELRPGQVLVEVAFSGVCHSQLLEVRGKRGPDRFLPHTLGHEGSGTVLAVGAGVTKVRAGDRVVLTWIKGDGEEVPSSAYDSEQGVINSGAVSTFLRHAVVSENRVVPLPPDMPLREAALLGCALPTGAGLVLNLADLRPGSSLAVFGVGGIGLSAVLAGRLREASPLIAVDVVESKLDDARRLGATHTLNARKSDPLATVLGLTGGRGVDCAVEAAGRRETMETAFRCVRDRGGLCILAGNLPHGEHIRVDPYDLIRGKRILGTWGGETRPDRDVPLYAAWFREGRLPLAELISREYPLAEVNEALDDLEGGRVARALINLAA